MKSLIKIMSRIWLYNNGYTRNIESEINFVKNVRQGSAITRGTSVSRLSAFKVSTVNEILVVLRVSIQQV
jgi:hypothetical protein